MQYRIWLLIFTFFIIVSCEKAPETKAIITVNDINGNPVQGATVWLSQNGQISPQGTVSNISDQQITDSQGQTVHIFDLEKVLNIDAQKTQGNDFLSGSDEIKLVKNETVFKTAAVTKLSRNLMLAVVVPALTWYWHSKMIINSASAGALSPSTFLTSFSKHFPSFLYGFLSICALRTIGDYIFMYDDIMLHNDENLTKWK